MNIYYVYQYLREDMTPYYIGKGKEQRAWQAHKRSNGANLLPKDKSKIQILAKDLSEQEAHLLETKLIAQYGRIDLGNGILRNLTDGGEGNSGYVPSKEVIEKIASKNRGQKRAQHSINMSGENNPFYNKKHNNETRQRMSDNHADVSGSNNPMYGKQHPNKGVTGQWKWSEESKKKLSGSNNSMYGKVSPNKGKSPAKLECPYCKKNISLANFNRWHGNNCKGHSSKQS